jgi:hypothetical protein
MCELIDFLEKYGVEYSTTDKHSRPGWVNVSPCPGCQSTKYHLGIRNDGQRASCWACGGKSPSKILKELTDAPWGEIKALLGDTRFIQPEEEKVYGGYKPPKNLIPFNKAHLNYLKGRHLDPEYLSKVWNMQGTGPMSNYPHRIFIPISRNKRDVSWTARTIIKGHEPRYQTARDLEKSFHEKHLIYGLDRFRGNTLIVNEGPLDTVNVGPGAGCVFGLSYTSEQVAIIAKFHRRIIVFDSSDSAQRVAEKLCEDLAVFPGITQRVVLDADDPGSADRNEINLLRRFAGLPGL